MRGEKPHTGTLSVPFTGSSPLARGKAAINPTHGMRDGIIPACAGKRNACPASLASMADHPRLRGEKTSQASGALCPHGSSPLARGKALKTNSALVCGGIIPACAGKRGEAPTVRLRAKDHPRLRGEKIVYDEEMQCYRGSSPLARGKVPVPLFRPLLRGIIPACAGKRILTSRGATQPQDHPRLRGEKRRGDPRQHRTIGSSPLARGKVLTNGQWMTDDRIIPACAGKRARR